MKKHLLALFAAAVAFCASANRMGCIADDAFIDRISTPETHDSATEESTKLDSFAHSPDLSLPDASESGIRAGNETLRHRISVSASLTSAYSYSVEWGFHYMVSPNFGIGGSVGYWKNYFEDGWASGDGWNIDEEDNKPSNIYLRPSFIVKTPSIGIKATRWSLFVEPSVMLNIPYQRVCIENVLHRHITRYEYISTHGGQWFAAELRIGISAKIDQLHATAGYLISNLDIYSQYRHLRYRGESFEQFYPVISSMQGAFISLSYEF